MFSFVILYILYHFYCSAHSCQCQTKLINKIINLLKLIIYLFLFRFEQQSFTITFFMLIVKLCCSNLNENKKLLISIS
jgi:hypothetical protein